MVKVLIVDDEPAYRESLKLLVPCEGYDVQTAAGREEAENIARSFCPDVLVVDWMLQDHGDGLDLAEALSAAIPGLGIVLISGYPTQSLDARVRALGNVRFVAKPFSLSGLVAAIEEALRL